MTFEIRRPYMEGPEKWNQANTVSSHSTEKAARWALRRLQRSASATRGFLMDQICVQRDGVWVPFGSLDQTDE